MEMLLSNYIPYIAPATYTIIASTVAVSCCCITMINEGCCRYDANNSEGPESITGIDACAIMSIICFLPLAIVCCAVSSKATLNTIIITHSIWGGCGLVCSSIGGMWGCAKNMEIDQDDDIGCVNEQPQPEQDSVIIAEPITNEVQECVIINELNVNIINTIVQAVIVNGNDYKECDF